MSKKVGIITVNGIRFHTIKKTCKPIVEIGGRYYRIDDKLFVGQSDAPNALIMYGLDDSQYYGDGQYLDPDTTKKYIDSMKSGNGKATKLDGFSINKMLPLIVLAAIIMSAAYVFMR